MPGPQLDEMYDVIIIGAGPAGLTAAAWMSVSGIKTLLVDKNPSPPASGHADGIECRTFEILDTFGLGKTVWEEANQTVEVAYWNDSEGSIRRLFTNPNSATALQYHSTYSEATLAQGRIEQHLLDFIRTHEAVSILRCYEPRTIRFVTQESGHITGYPIQVGISPCYPQDHDLESSAECAPWPQKQVRARYLLGCDGAHSWVRKQCGLELEGESTDEHWGVMDCVPITTFPDVRKRCIIHSAAGSAMLIPRERRLVRFYVRLSCFAQQLSPVKQRRVIIDKITQVLKPYEFTCSIIDWESIYSVGQRLCKQYSFSHRVFLAGDAVHTHSPKAGQGMNTSMQDAFNIGWKIAAVVQGAARPAILDTYQQERLPIGQRLLSFDKEIYGAISCNSNGYSGENLKQALRKENSSASGLAVAYRTNLLISSLYSCDTASDRALQTGSRLPDLGVMNHSDGRLWRMHEVLNNSGRWNLLVFGGDVSKERQMGRVQVLAMELSQPSSVIQRINRKTGLHSFGCIETILIHSGPRHRIELHRLPSIFIPHEGPMGFNYTKAFADTASHDGSGGIVYRELDIPDAGCIMLVRPDHHVAFRGHFGEASQMCRFLSSFWICD